MQHSASLTEVPNPTRKIETIRNHQTGVISCRTPVGSTILVFPDGEVQISHPDRSTVIVVDPAGRTHEYMVTPCDEPDEKKASQRGSVIVEFALALPIVILISLGAMDLCWDATAKQNLDYVAEQSALCTQKASCDPTALAQSNVQGLTLNPANLTVTVDGNTVSATYQASGLTGFLPTITLTSKATAAQ